jgi:hypothetical protein
LLGQVLAGKRDDLVDTLGPGDADDGGGDARVPRRELRVISTSKAPVRR